MAIFDCRDVSELDALLLQADGFLVDAMPDEPVGVVDEILVDQDGHPLALVISTGWFGRRQLRVSIEDVVDIWPRRRLLRLRRSAARLDADNRGA